MNRDFFVRLAFATHRVADALPESEEIAEEMKDSANTILVDLILFTEKDALSREKKRMLLPQALVREQEGEALAGLALAPQMKNQRTQALASLCFLPSQN